jgi:hypothetical protein
LPDKHEALVQTPVPPLKKEKKAERDKTVIIHK